MRLAIVENGKLQNDRQVNFFSVLGSLNAAEFLQLTAVETALAIGQPVIKAGADNLILKVIISDGVKHPTAEKKFFTRNTSDFDAPAVHAALSGAGIDLLTSAAAVLNWLRNR